MTNDKEQLQSELYDICGEIEEHAGQVAGIQIAFSDYWLVCLRDWAYDDKQEEEILAWVADHYKLKDKDYVQCFVHDPLMQVALYVHLFRQDQ